MKYDSDQSATEAPDDKPARLRKFKAWFKADKEHVKEWRKQAKEDFEFLAGDQWTHEEREKLKSELRPVITFNRTNPIIQSVSGMEIANRKEVKYFPREAGDARPNEILTEGAKWFRDVSDADDEDSDAFIDTLVCGLGATESTLDFEENEKGDPMVSAVNALEVMWDKAARKKNFTDRRRTWRIRKIPYSRACEIFPDADKRKLDARWAHLDAEIDPESQEEADRYEGDGEKLDIEEKDVTIVHLEYKERVKVTVVMDPMTGQRMELDGAKASRLLKRAEMIGRQFQVLGKKEVTKVRKVFIGADVLEEGDALCDKHFSIQIITGYIDRNTGLPYGLMRLMKDPQRWANKWMSQALHILNSNAKGGLMVEEGATDNVRQLEKDWAKPNKVIKVASGALSGGQIQERQPAPLPAGFFQMMEFAISSVRDVTGISVEMLGMREADQAASLEYQRRQAGMTILAPLFDNLKRYRREHGKLMLYIIQNYLNDGRLIRIVGEEGAQYVPLALQSELEYDIIVDDQINSPDQKLMIWQTLGPILPTLPPQIQLALVDYAPLPQTVIEKIKEAAKGLGPTPEQQAMVRAEIEKLQAEIEKLRADAMKNTAQAQQIANESGEGQQMAEMAKIQQTGAIKSAELVQKGQIERENMAQQGQLKREEMGQDAVLSLFQSAIDAQLEKKRIEMQPRKADNAVRA